MFVKVSPLIVLLLLANVSLAQTATQKLKTQEQFISVLTEQVQNPQAIDGLLKTHPELVNAQLWALLIDRAATQYYSKEPKRSLIAYDLASLVAGEMKDPRLLAITHYYSGRAYSGLNELSQAVGAYEKSRAYFEQAGLRRDLIYILADLGSLYVILGDYSRAKDYSERALAMLEETKKEKRLPAIWPDEYGQTRALATLAEISLREGDYNQAIRQLRTSLELRKQSSCCYPDDTAGDLQALGRVFTASGDYKQALVYLNQALEIVKKTFWGDPTALPSLRNSIGILYLEQEDYAQAKAQFEESLRIYRSQKDIREEARVLLNLGVIEQRQSNHDEALRYFRQAIESAKAIRFAEIEILAGEGIGVVLTAKKEFEEAKRVMNESLALARSSNDKTRQAELLWRIAQTHYDLRDFAQSTLLSQEALKLAQAHVPKVVYLAATTLGQSYAAQNKIDLATQTLKAAVDQIEAHRNLIAGREVGVQLFFENRVDTYHALIELLVKQGRLSDALSYAERAKGRVLLDVLREGKGDLAKTITAAEKEQALNLKRNILELNDRLRRAEAKTASNETLVKQLYLKRDQARLEYESFENSLFSAHPELNVRRGRTAPLSSAEISNLTRTSQTAFIEYVVTKERVYLFVLKGSDPVDGPEVKVYLLPVKPTDLAGKVEQFHQRLANRHPDFAGLARELYSVLIEPASQQLRGSSTICIVPDGFLWNLPFQALLKGDNRYFIEDVALYYAPSLTVLREMTKDRLGKNKRVTSLLALGNPAIAKGENLNNEVCPLPEAEIEVKSVAKSVGSTGSRVLIRREASERSFKTLAPVYSTIHLATHGVLDNKRPLYSHLLLTKTVGDPENDGLLEAREIMNMNLEADLAVLSACETANGRIAPGEGVMGMSWAFFVAGARSMLVSQWRVNSASTSKLMVNFYQARESHHRINDNKAKALQDAALRMMKDQRYRHPFYWAGFVMIGNAR